MLHDTVAFIHPTHGLFWATSVFIVVAISEEYGLSQALLSGCQTPLCITFYFCNGARIQLRQVSLICCIAYFHVLNSGPN